MNIGLLSFFNSIANETSAASLPASNNFDVFISAGQSNIDGRSPIDEAPSWLKSALLKIKVWNDSLSQFNTFQLGVNTGADWNATTSWAFDIIFYRMYAEYHNKNLFIIKRSKGGTPLFIDPSNIKGSWNVDYNSFPAGIQKLSQELETYFLNAKNYADNYGKTLNIKAMLWYQGSTDVQTEGAVSAYKENLIALINRMRLVFNKPDMPFLIVTQSGNSATYSAQLEQSQNEIKAELSNIFVVSASDLTMRDDLVHIDGPSSIVAGERVFDLFKDI